MRHDDRNNEQPDESAGGEIPFEPFISKRTVAERIDLKQRTVSRLMSNGVLRYYKVGEIVRFLWSEVQTDIREHCQKRGQP